LQQWCFDSFTMSSAGRPDAEDHYMVISVLIDPSVLLMFPNFAKINTIPSCHHSVLMLQLFLPWFKCAIPTMFRPCDIQ